MSEERKKPKIDLKSRIPSKTVKGLTLGKGNVIPPPPGAVPAPPPDFMPKPKISLDPNDPLGAARVEGSDTHKPIFVVQASENESPSSKKGVLYALIGLGIMVGLGGGYIVGSNRARGEVASKAKADAKELQSKVSKTTDELTQFTDTLKQAANELSTKQELSATTIDAIKNFNLGFSSNDLKSREIAYFGEDTANKLLIFAAKINHMEELKASLSKNSGLENINTQIKAFTIPAGKSRYGIQISKPDDKAMVSMATIFDLGEPTDLKEKLDLPNHKLKTKNGDVDVWPAGDAKADFWSKNFISPLEGKSFLQVCPIRNQFMGKAQQDFQDMITAIEGTSEEPGILETGKELSDKLKSLVAGK